MNTLMRIVHVLALGTWAGTSVFFTGCVALRIFGYFAGLAAHPTPGLAPVSKELSTRMAGDLIATIFPTYFGIQCVAGALAALSAWHLTRDGGRLQLVQAVMLTGIWLVVLLHAGTLYRRASAIRQEHYAALDAGRTQEAAQLRQQFFALHGPSLLLNIATTALVLVCLGLAGPALAVKADRAAPAIAPHTAVYIEPEPSDKGDSDEPQN